VVAAWAACLAALPCRATQGAEAATAAEAAVERLDLETTDGVRIAAWHYPAPAGEKAVATVILVHDIEGSHNTVDHLARSLQRAGCTVVAPDLRSHGASGSRGEGGPGPRADADPRLLKKNDLETIAAAAGGRLREQSSVRGDIEAVRTWIKRRSDGNAIDIDRLCVVGSGLGATLAAMWTVADWNWQPTTTGPQGQQVRALVLVSPVLATKGVSLTGPLATEPFKRSVPIMVFSGSKDKDAAKLFDQLKRLRPREWIEVREGQPPAKAPQVEETTDASVFLVQFKTTLTADKLVEDPAINAGDQLKAFFQLALARKPR
jgi:dienelactone hydrolase